VVIHQQLHSTHIPTEIQQKHLRGYV
jgi:hypothetical protein